jgi:APC cysteine-rich region.
MTVRVSSVSNVIYICVSCKSVKEGIPARNELLNAVFLTSGKVVTFGGADLYAEETPLMFSRCSSLCSLSSIEQHSIHDDRSSVISDFR